MHAARRSVRSTSAPTTKPGTDDRLVEPVLAHELPAPASRSGPSPRIAARSSRCARRSSGDGRHQARHALLRDVAARRTPPAARRARARAGSSEPAYSPSSIGRRRRGRRSPRRRCGVQAREAERALRDAHAQRLHRVADRARRRRRGTRPSTRGSTPRASRRPAGSGASGRSGRGGQQREVGERGGVHHLVAAPWRSRCKSTPRPNTSGGRMRRRPALGVELHARAHRDHAHAGHLAALAALPLAQRQVGHLVALGREPLAEVAVPALGAADRVGEEAVVDQADAHRAGGAFQTVRYHRRANARLPGRRRVLLSDTEPFEADSPEHRRADNTSAQHRRPSAAEPSRSRS